MSRRTEWILFGLILLIAGLLRMAAPGWTEFKADEARLYALALDMAEGEFALRGISSSVGFPNFPASVWVYAIPLILWPHPYAATIFTGLLNTLAIVAGYWFVRRYWGSYAALAATLMIAVSPWAIIFSRKIWAQNLLPIFVMGWVIGAALAFVEERPRFIWLHLVSLVLAVQIHLAAVALIPGTLLLLIVFYKRIQWRSLLTGILLAALTAVPFALYLGGEFRRGGLPGISAADSGFELSLDSFRFLTTISLGTNIHSLAGSQLYNTFSTQVPGLSIAHWIWGLLILGGVFWLGFQAWRNWSDRPSQVGFIVLVWLLAPAVFFFAHTTPVFIHYFIATLPAQYIAAGIFLSRLPEIFSRSEPARVNREKRIWLIAGGTLLILTAIIQARAFVILLSLLSSTATPGGFGVPLAMKMQAVQELQTLLEETGANEILVAGAGEKPNVNPFPAEWDVLLRNSPHRFIDMNSAALFPAQSAVILLDGREINPPWTGDLYLETATSVQEIELREGEGVYYLLTIPGEAKPPPDLPTNPPYLLANWVNFTGHDSLERLDEMTGIWQIHWRTGDNPDPANYQFFNHLIDGNDQRIGQVDSAAFSPGEWRAGDQLISRFLLPWPDTAIPPLAVRVGMYHYPSLENVPLLDEAGNPYVDAATFSIDNDRE